MPDESRERVPRRELVEGADYYIENGKWVFTAAFHLARGRCCESGCRHCPYGAEDRPGDERREL